MSMWPRPGYGVPEQTAWVARAAFPKGCLAIRVRDALGELFADAQFVELWRPGLSPARLALVLILQFVEGRTDRQAADAVRGRLDWTAVDVVVLCGGGANLPLVARELAGRGRGVDVPARPELTVARGTAAAETYALEVTNALQAGAAAKREKGWPAITVALAVVAGGDLTTWMARLLERADREFYPPGARR